MEMRDTYGRRITDLRVSVTDRCDFRCIYCRSADPENYMPLEHLLTWEELERVVSILLPFGIQKVRVTGGEPLVRAGLEKFIGRLSALGVEDLSMTTNARMLAPRVGVLVAAGLRRINISLDSLDRERFERITRIAAFDEVIKGIDAAQASALAPVKVNAVLVRGVNDDEVEAFAEFARHRRLIMRFIEVMPLDGDRHWSRSMVVTGAEVLKRIRAKWEMIPVAHERTETARRYRFADGIGEIGLVSPVSDPFCGFCSRIRLTADGKLRTCLFSREDHDLRPLLRGGASDAEIAAKIETIVAEKEAGHRINEPDFVQPVRTMVFIGG
jgi:cyclic pyranopterin phosphate synthase